MTRLSEITAEQVCAQMYPATWADYLLREKDHPLRLAQRHLDAIRALAAQDEVKS